MEAWGREVSVEETAEAGESVKAGNAANGETAATAEKAAESETAANGETAATVGKIATMEAVSEPEVAEETKAEAEAEEEETEAEAEAEEEEAEGVKTAIVFSSYSFGNTENVADYMFRLVHGSYLQVEPSEAYPPYEGEVCPFVDQVELEMADHYKKRIQPLDISAYDFIVLGTPVWFERISLPMEVFLKTTNWEGKTVCLFTTHDGKPGNVLEDMKALVAGAEIGPCAEIEHYQNGWDNQISDFDAFYLWASQVKQCWYDHGGKDPIYHFDEPKPEGEAQESRESEESGEPEERGDSK